MAASGNEKILRIGVIQGGKVIEERLVRKRTTVTFGSENKNTFVFAGGEFPKSWPLFELKGSQYELVFSEKMDGRVSVDNANVDFGSLKAQNLAKKQGDRFRLPLNDGSRGRVQFAGDLTILFHFVAPPPVAAKPELPMSIKGGWVKQIEPIFTTTLAISFLLHALMTIVVWNVEPAPPPSREEVLQAIAKVTPQKIEAPPPPDAEPTEGPSDDDKGPPKDEPVEEDPGPADPGPPKSKKDAAARAAAAEAKRAAVREQIAGKGLLAMIGAAGGSSDSAVANVFGSGSAIGGDLQGALEGTAGVGIAGGGAVTRRGAGGGGSGSAADVGSLGAGGGGAVSTGTKQKAKIKARVKADAISDVDGTIDKRGVARAIRRRQAAFQQCYETALKSNSKLKGKIVVEFTIGDRGRVTEAIVIRDGLGSSQVAKCVIGVLKRLRFPAPSDGEVTITNSFVFQPGG
jgi:outer membrane biosynthesis protein TonB